MSITESMTRIAPIVMNAAAQSSLHDLVQAQKCQQYNESFVFDGSSNSVTPLAVINDETELTGSENTEPAGIY